LAILVVLGPVSALGADPFGGVPPASTAELEAVRGMGLNLGLNLNLGFKLPDLNLKLGPVAPLGPADLVQGVQITGDVTVTKTQAETGVTVELVRAQSEDLLHGGPIEQTANDTKTFVDVGLSAQTGLSAQVLNTDSNVDIQTTANVTMTLQPALMAQMQATARQAATLGSISRAMEAGLVGSLRP
jgi:hypothetical protein